MDTDRQFEAFKKRGSSEDLIALLQSCQGAVYTLCLVVLRHPQDAEDAAQEVLVEIARNLPRISDPIHFRRWVYSVSFHTSLRAKSAARSRIRLLEIHQPDGLDPKDIPASLETAAALHEHLGRLSDDLRAIVVEHYFERRSLAMLARDYGCSTVALWKKLQKAREILRRSLVGAGMGAGALAILSSLEAQEFVPAPRELLDAGLIARINLLPSPRPRTFHPVAIAVFGGILLLGIAAISFFRSGGTGASAMTALRPAVAERPRPHETHSGPDIVTSKAEPPAHAEPNVAVRKPYPYQIPLPEWGPGARRTWELIQARTLTLQCESKAYPEILGEISRQLVVPIRAEANLESWQASIRISGFPADLFLSSGLWMTMDFRIEEDGTLRAVLTGLKGDPARLGDSSSVASVRHTLAAISDAGRRLEEGWNGFDEEEQPFEREARRTKAALQQGEWTVREILDQLSKASGLVVMLEGEAATGVESKEGSLRRLNVVEELTVLEHVQKLCRDTNLEYWFDGQGSILVGTSEAATQSRSNRSGWDAASREHRERMDRPLGAVELRSTLDLIEVLSKGSGLQVIPSRRFWEAELPSGWKTAPTVRETLDRLKDAGFRWALVQGVLYLL